jgi:hypothetical protein
VKPALSNLSDSFWFQRVPWVFAAGAAMAGAGAGLTVASAQSSPAPLLAVSATVVLVAALLELSAGISLHRHGGAGMSHTIGGATALVLSLFLFAVWRVMTPHAFAPAPAALVLGLYCVCNGIFRTLDVAISRPLASTFEGFDGGFTLMLGLWVLQSWQHANLASVAAVAGLEILVGGFAMAASSISHLRQPEQPAYDDLQTRLQVAQSAHPKAVR